jgi:hypothetical protein
VELNIHPLRPSKYWPLTMRMMPTADHTLLTALVWPLLSSKQWLLKTLLCASRPARKSFTQTVAVRSPVRAGHTINKQRHAVSVLALGALSIPPTPANVSTGTKMLMPTLSVDGLHADQVKQANFHLSLHMLW